MAKMLVASVQVDSESGQTTEVRNPATGEIVDTVPKGTINDVRRAIDVAQSALKKWSTMWDYFVRRAKKFRTALQ